MGKLYLNYPMVEAFYHMKSIPDGEYNSRFATMAELQAKEYKKRVNVENRDHNYTKFAKGRDECNTVIHQNIDKAFSLCGYRKGKASPVPDSGDILAIQLETIEKNRGYRAVYMCILYRGV